MHHITRKKSISIAQLYGGASPLGVGGVGGGVGGVSGFDTAALRMATRMLSSVAGDDFAVDAVVAVDAVSDAAVDAARLMGTRPTQSGMGMPNHVEPLPPGDGLGGLGEGVGGLGDFGFLPSDAATLMMPCGVEEGV